MLMRVAVGIHKDDIDSVLKTYHLTSQRWFTHATPTLFNAGTPQPQVRLCGFSFLSHFDHDAYFFFILTHVIFHFFVLDVTFLTFEI